MRLFVVGPLGAATVDACTLETSWKMVSLTVPFSLICGLTFSVKPTSLRSTVWNGLTVLPLVPVLVKLPVTKGTFWPTTILASSLSSATRLGVDRMLVPETVSRKRASAPSV